MYPIQNYFKNLNLLPNPIAFNPNPRSGSDMLPDQSRLSLFTMHGFMNRSKFAYISVSIMNACVVGEGVVSRSLPITSFSLLISFFSIFNILPQKVGGGEENSMIINFNKNLCCERRREGGQPLSPAPRCNEPDK